MVYTSSPPSPGGHSLPDPRGPILAPVKAQLIRQVILMAMGLAGIPAVIVRCVRHHQPAAEAGGFRRPDLLRRLLSGRIEGIRGKDEIQELAGVLNQMVGDLKPSHQDFAAATKAKESVESEFGIARQNPGIPPAPGFPAVPRTDGVRPLRQECAGPRTSPGTSTISFSGRGSFGRPDRRRPGKGVLAALFMAVNRTPMKTVCRK